MSGRSLDLSFLAVTLLYIYILFRVIGGGKSDWKLLSIDYDDRYTEFLGLSFVSNCSRGEFCFNARQFALDR